MVAQPITGDHDFKKNGTIRWHLHTSLSFSVDLVLKMTIFEKY